MPMVHAQSVFTQDNHNLGGTPPAVHFHLLLSSPTQSSAVAQIGAVLALGAALGVPPVVVRLAEGRGLMHVTTPRVDFWHVRSGVDDVRAAAAGALGTALWQTVTLANC